MGSSNKALVEPFIYLLLLVLAGCLSWGVYLLMKLHRSEKDKQNLRQQFETLEKKINGLHLQSLESKLNPHLFKNILNSIQSHAYQTYFALDKLASVLDYILYESRNRFVTPQAEIEFAMNLIEINKIKVSPLMDLNVKIKVNEADPLYTQPLLAPMVSIDLIENAFKHADLQSQDAFISVIFEFRENTFYLTVSNKMSPRPPIKKRKGGLGTETLEQRLKLIYKDNFKLDRFTEGDVYIAHLKINLFEYKAEMLAAR